jgi:protein gp37
MSRSTGILWADAVWSPVVGCSKTSPGCESCWAMGMARRQVAQGNYPKALLTTEGKWSGEICMRHKALAEPISWKTPKTVAVCLMGDLFHKNTPDYMIRSVMWTMWNCRDRHTFLILTKRPFVMRKFFSEYEKNPIDNTDPWPWNHVWLGTSVEDQIRADIRIPALLQTQAAVRFVSFEPLLGHVDAVQYIEKSKYRNSIDWAIIGAESKNGRIGRECRREWIESLMCLCIAQRTPVFLKQQADATGKLIDLPVLFGRRWFQFPRLVGTSQKCMKFLEKEI